MRVLIAGGGVAALEAALTLRDLAPGRVEVELLAPEPKFWYRPLAVVEPFGTGVVHGLDLAAAARACGGRFTLGAVASVDPVRRLVTTAAGARFEYDALLVAAGARPVPAVAGALTFRGPANNGAFRDLLADVDAGTVRHLAFAVPGGVSWPLPLYELALLTAVFARRRARITFVTPEQRPLAMFGGEASAAVEELLAEHEIDVRTSSLPMAAREGTLVVAPGRDTIAADRVVSVPRLRGAPVDGLPRDWNGFVPTDAFGAVPGLRDVFAAGDVTAFPVKQGGIAAQQAGVAAESIARLAGAEVAPRPFHPVLRAVLLTGAEPRYLRADLAAGAGETSTVATRPLWWPPGKIVGRRLSPFLAEQADLILTTR